MRFDKMSIERLTTSLQFVGAALALPAGAAGIYSAYHNYFSTEVMCQEMRNTTLVTLEKNIPAEAKHALLRKEVSEFEARCAEAEPETTTILQVALQELEKPQHYRTRSAQPASPEKPSAGAATAMVAPAAATAAAVPAAAPAEPAAGLGLGLAVHGWVAIEMRKGAKVTEAYFSGYAATGQSLPGTGTVLTAMTLRPIWSEPQGPGPNDPTKLQGRLKAGECVRVLGTRSSPARQWAEVEPTLCQ
jgi:hypothetical protein